jgi:uncharacterized membrane protein
LKGCNEEFSTAFANIIPPYNMRRQLEVIILTITEISRFKASLLPTSRTAKKYTNLFVVE